MAKKKYSYFEIEISKNFPLGISTQFDWEPRTNIIELTEAIIVEAELPGVNKNDISMVLQGDRELIIKGVKNQPKLDESQMTYYLFEREFGTFYKKIITDFPLETTSIQSVMKNGVLSIRIAKKKAKKIAVDIR